MIALSIKLTEELDKTSRKLAGKLGISRSELIRQALAHEIDQLEAHFERQAMADSLRAMAKRKKELGELEMLDHALDEPLPEEKEGWWSR